MAKGLADLRTITDERGYIPSSSWTRELSGWTDEDRANLFQELDTHFGGEKIITGWSPVEGDTGLGSMVFDSRAGSVQNMGSTGLTGEWMAGMNYASPFAPPEEQEAILRAYDLYIQDNGYGLKDKIAQGVARALGYVASAYGGPVTGAAYAVADAAAQTAARQGSGADFLKKAVPGAVLSYVGGSALGGAEGAVEGAGGTVMDAVAEAGRTAGQAATNTVMYGTPTLTEITRAALDQTGVGSLASKGTLKSLQSVLSPTVGFKGFSQEVNPAGSMGGGAAESEYADLIAGSTTGMLRSTGLDEAATTGASTSTPGYYSDIIDELNRLRKKRTGAF